MAQASYITQAELEEACDVNLVRRLGSDTSAPGDGTDTIVDNAIQRASARIESVALRAGRYTTTSLASIQTDDSWILKGLCADLALVILYERRGPIPDDLRRRKDQTDKLLEQLAQGQMIFGDSAAVGAGKVGVTIIDANERNEGKLVADTDFFPRRLERKL